MWLLAAISSRRGQPIRLAARNEFSAIPPKLTKHSMPGSSMAATLRSHRSQSKCHRQPLGDGVADPAFVPGFHRRRIIPLELTDLARVLDELGEVLSQAAAVIT